MKAVKENHSVLLCEQERLILKIHKDLDMAVSVMQLIKDQAESINKAANFITSSFLEGGKLLLCGNGGSFSDCQHFEAELVGRMGIDRRPLPALTLGSSGSSMTCVSNDFHFQEVFSRQIEALGGPSDCLLAISTSGRSPSVLNALKTARKQGLVTIGLLGCDGGAALSLCDIAVVVPCNRTERVQESHIFIVHQICSIIEELLGFN